MGVWIETDTYTNALKNIKVTPCVGVWIETRQEPQTQTRCSVTPCVGVWIETFSSVVALTIDRHTLRGCVD